MRNKSSTFVTPIAIITRNPVHNAMKPDNSKRLLYIDALRGMTMILVVYYHITNHCFPETILDKGLQSFRMPLFFFVSGFIAFKDLGLWTARNTAWRLLNKFRVQIIPTVIFFSLYCCLFYECNPFTFFASYGWRHYWFTIVLFEFFVVYFTACFITRKSTVINVTTLFALIVVSVVLFHTTAKTGKWSLYTQLYALLLHAPFFLFGTLARRYFDNIRRWLETWWILLIDAILFFVQLIIYTLSLNHILSMPQQIVNFMVTWPLRITGVIMVFGLFVKYRNRFTADCPVTRALTFIGRRTLDIYLMHFFFTAHAKRGLAYVTNLYEALGRPYTIVATGLVIVACLLVSALIRKCKPAGKLLFGAKY